MSETLIVHFYPASLKPTSEVLPPLSVDTIRPSQNPSIFYSILLGLPSPKSVRVLAFRTDLATGGDRIPGGVELKSNPARTAVNLRFFSRKAASSRHCALRRHESPKQALLPSFALGLLPSSFPSYSFAVFALSFFVFFLPLCALVPLVFKSFLFSLASYMP